MTNMAIDAGKKKSYFVVEQDGSVVRECYVNAGRESFSSLVGEYPGLSGYGHTFLLIIHNKQLQIKVLHETLMMNLMRKSSSKSSLSR